MLSRYSIDGGRQAATSNFRSLSTKLPTPAEHTSDDLSHRARGALQRRYAKSLFPVSGITRSGESSPWANEVFGAPSCSEKWTTAQAYLRLRMAEPQNDTSGAVLSMSLPRRGYPFCHLYLHCTESRPGTMRKSGALPTPTVLRQLKAPAKPGTARPCRASQGRLGHAAGFRGLNLDMPVHCV